MHHYIEQYGYLAVLVGTILEGGTLLTMAGFLAHRGYLQLVPWVILVGSLGSMIDGQVWFVAARHYGFRLARRRKSWARGLRRLDRLYHRWPEAVVVLGRFVPGVRTASYIGAGLTHLSVLRYTVLNIIGSVLWAATIACIGYLFGQVVETFLGNVRHLERPLLLIMLVAGLTWWIWTQLRPRNEPS